MFLPKIDAARLECAMGTPQGTSLLFRLHFNLSFKFNVHTLLAKPDFEISGNPARQAYESLIWNMEISDKWLENDALTVAGWGGVVRFYQQQTGHLFHHTWPTAQQTQTILHCAFGIKLLRLKARWTHPHKHAWGRPPVVQIHMPPSAADD